MATGSLTACTALLIPEVAAAARSEEGEAEEG